MPTPRADESDAVMEDGIGQHDKALHPLCDFEFTFESSMLMIEPDYPSSAANLFADETLEAYVFPNDEKEQERLALQGPIMQKLMGGKLHFAPISVENYPHFILDIATGIGDWAIEMADEFPDSRIIATDLSPIQPNYVPSNVRFYVEDATEPWDFPHKFNFIHTRLTGGCWEDFEKQIAAQAFDALEPGGWFESQEVDCNISCDDGTLNPCGPIVSWISDLILAADRMGRPTLLGPILKRAYENVGFVDVQQRVYKMPLNSWPKNRYLKQIGLLWGHNLVEGLSAFSYQLLHHGFNRSAEEIEVSWHMVIYLNRSRQKDHV
ncbi:methyltransferase, putative [Metarhizium acridum CQMa 102]|uniref:Methyltransferase, putative n=1 Tax=Metarhizium acridum (strain CQMa 102) TaxID=655827 RepID=E9EFR5_METAQ|nr:methyltransferase, putative [Metarhizium acridum CQMa 102]EFY85253.1 methyltransferase, putative [Metarhizium acridum CQMa 102]